MDGGFESLSTLMEKRELLIEKLEKLQERIRKTSELVGSKDKKYHESFAAQKHFSSSLWIRSQKNGVFSLTSRGVELAHEIFNKFASKTAEGTTGITARYFRRGYLAKRCFSRQYFFELRIRVFSKQINTMDENEIILHCDE